LTIRSGHRAEYDYCGYKQRRPSVTKDSFDITHAYDTCGLMELSSFDSSCP